MSHADASQLAVEARDLALEDVCRMLQNPEDLTRLASLRAEYEKARNVNELQLASLVQSRVEAAQFSKELLDRSQKAVSKLKACFEQIDSLCEACASLVENHEKIQELAVAHHNITRTLQEVDDIIDLPSNAAIAEEMLKDDTLLLEAFKAVSGLEGTSTIVVEAMKTNDRRSGEQEHLRDYFNKVELSATKLEDKLWEHFHEFYELSMSSPGLLVACNQIVEMQELIDAELPVAKRKEFKKRSRQVMDQSITDRFNPILNQCSKLKEPAESDTENEDNEAEPIVSEILSESTKLSRQLIDIYDLTEPCFPSQDKIFQHLLRCYHTNFARCIDRLGTYAHRFDNKSILDIVRWVESYNDTLRTLGVADEDLHLPKASSDAEISEEVRREGGLSAMMNVYIDRDKKSTTAWYLNILESDVASEPKVNKNGKLWTPGFVDFFRILNDGTAAVETETNGEMLYRSASTALQMMKEFIAAETAILQRDVQPHILCAFTNNNIRAYDLSIEFVEHFDEVVQEQYRNKLEAEDVFRGFLDVAKLAMKKLVESVFSDPGVIGILRKLYQSEWQSGEITSTLIATLQDYLEEFAEYLDESIYKRIVEAALVKSISSYTSALVQRMPSITESVIEQMRCDEKAFRSFFDTLMTPSKVEGHVQQLTNMRQLACAADIEGFVFAYLSILDATPDTSPSIVEKVCTARSDINRSDANEIIVQCRDLFHQRQQKRQAEGDTTSHTDSSYLVEVKTHLWTKFMGQ